MNLNEGFFRLCFFVYFCLFSYESTLTILRLICLQEPQLFVFHLCPRQYLLAQSQQWKYKSDMWIMFQVNNKQTRRCHLGVTKKCGNTYNMTENGDFFKTPPVGHMNILKVWETFIWRLGRHKNIIWILSFVCMSTGLCKNVWRKQVAVFRKRPNSTKS